MGSTPIAGTNSNYGRNTMDLMTTLLPLAALIILTYVLMIKPQQKREKAAKQMRSSVQVGDEIITIGGICGKVVKTKEESIVIQVGADKTKFEIMRWAISQIVNGSGSVGKSDEGKEEEAPKKALPKRLKKAESEPEQAPASDDAASESMQA